MDVLGTHAHGLPIDHTGTFSKLAGLAIAAEQAQSPGTAHYIATLEYGYALHEPTFGLLFLAIVLFAFRRGERWAWFACWAVLVASLGYTLTFGVHDSTITSRSLIADVTLPLLLLICAPSFFRRATRSRLPSRPYPVRLPAPAARRAAPSPARAVPLSGTSTVTRCGRYVRSTSARERRACFRALVRDSSATGKTAGSLLAGSDRRSPLTASRASPLRRTHLRAGGRVSSR